MSKETNKSSAEPTLLINLNQIAKINLVRNHQLILILFIRDQASDVIDLLPDCSNRSLIPFLFQHFNNLLGVINFLKAYDITLRLLYLLPYKI